MEEVTDWIDVDRQYIRKNIDENIAQWGNIA
jgi:hypothetical protein